MSRLQFVKRKQIQFNKNNNNKSKNKTVDMTENIFAVYFNTSDFYQQ